MRLSVQINYNCCVYTYTDGKAYHGAYFGLGSGPIFLDDVNCSTRLNQLLECYSRPILHHNCHHSADAGVSCEGKFQK